LEAAVPRVSATPGAAPPDGVQAVVLALRILEKLADEGRPIGVSALAEALGTTKSRIWRYLQTLVGEGYVVQAADTERYRLGSRAARFGRAATERLDIVSAGFHAMRDLRDSLGHFTVISQVEAQGVRVLATASGKAPIEIGVRQGSLLGFHSSAQGKIALAFGPDALRAAAFTLRLSQATPETITTPARLRADIERVRQQGWASASNQSVIGINALAAPVFDADGALVGALAIVDSVQFIPEPPTAEQIRQTIAAANRAAAALGYGRD
jgi:DNA-binding IclR family transcriptional regulator